MTVARTFVLITDCLVCMGSFFLGLVCVLVFSGVFMFLPVHVRKRDDRLKPATTAQFFSIASGCAVKNPSIVIQFAAAKPLYDNAPIHATSGDPTARRLEQRRRGSAGEVVPACAS